jgi:hypothetical protein
MPAAINPTPMPEGNLVQFLVSELAQRGVTPPQSQPLPAIQATWQTFEQVCPAEAREPRNMARNCSLRDFDQLFPIIPHVIRDTRRHSSFTTAAFLTCAHQKQNFFFNVHGEVFPSIFRL